jgi:hypothetical protein
VKKKNKLNDDEIERLAGFIKANHRGPENATSNRVLARTFALTDLGSAGRPGIACSSALTDAILRAKKRGHPIACDHRGVFYARHREDVTDALQHYRHCEFR